MREFPRPNVFVSACIEQDSCRFDGEKIKNEYVARLLPFINITKACPELAIGMGAPREAVRLVKRKGEDIKLLSSNKGNDYTDKMNSFVKKYTPKLQSKNLDGLIMKAKSPTCGVFSAKIYFDVGKAHVRENNQAGMFGREILDTFPDKPIETDRRLSNFSIRDNFFIQIFTLASFRKVEETKKMKDLVTFHSENKYLFMTYNQNTLRELGRIVANKEKKPIEEILFEYKQLLNKLFSSPASKKKRINVLEHIYGYFKNDVMKSEKDYYFEIQNDYLSNKIPFSNVVTILRGWAIRFNKEYISNQTIFEPYPKELIMVTDSGKKL